MYLRRFISSVLLAISIFASVQAADRQSVGLVLSGGGARGIAHVGVIQALEENNVSIDYITGTSMGAIIGSLYAMGYSPAEMMQLLESKEFIDWATGVINPKYTYYLLEKTPTPAQFNINLGKDGEDRSPLGEILPTSVVNPIPMSFGFMEIYGGATAQSEGNFDKLFVPLRTVCSDVYHKHKVVLSKGPLGDAVRASMSFPMIYQPIEIDSTLMYDGGIYDNYPFDVMHKDFNPDIMIGVDVSTPAKKPEPGQIMSQLETMIVQKSDYNLPADWGISLRIDLKKYPLFDWNNSRAIYEEGYQKGLSMIDSIKQRVTARTLPAELAARRAEWHKGTPRLRFDSVTVAGVNPQQREYLTHIFEIHKAQNMSVAADTFGVIHARNAFYRAVSPGRFKELTPHALYKPAQGIFTLNLDATMKRSFDVSAGGYLTTSSNSYLFFGGAYTNLTKHVTNADFSVWVGQSFMGALGRFKYGLSTSTPMSIGADMAIMRQKFYENDKMFYEFNSPLSLIQSQFYTQTHWRVATSRRSFFETGLGYGHLWSSYYPSFDSPLLSNEKEQTVFDLAQLYLKWDMSTLDNLNYPVTGSRITARLSGVTGAVKDARGSNWLNTKRHETYWTSLRAQATHYFPVIDKFSLGVMGDVLLSTRKLLDTYDGSMVSAPTFTPTASCYSSYNPGFRANSWVAAGLDPVWHPASIFQVRGSFNCFLPTREILAESDNLKPYYGSWFSSPKFFGEIRAMLTNPYTILSAWGNYKSSPTGIWSAGLSIGVFVLPPNFL